MQTKIIMPQLGESVTEGTIDHWLKREGDWVQRDEMLVEVVTDKVNAEVPSPVTGRLTQILVADGQTVPSRTDIALIESEEPAETQPSGDPADAPAATAPPASVPAGSTGATITDGEAGQAPDERSAESQHNRSVEERRRVPPVVRRLAEHYGLDLTQIAGSGYGGRLRKEDVMAYLAQRQAGVPSAGEGAAGASSAGKDEAPPPTTERPEPAQIAAESAPEAPDTAPALAGELIPLTPVRRAIAQHMTRSVQAAPQVTTSIEIDMTPVVKLRTQARDDFQRRNGIDLTYLAFFLKAVAASLVEHPLLNSTWTDEGVRLLRDVNVGVAVAVPAPEGQIGGESLLVPVIHHADRLNLRGLALATADLVERARAGKLTPDDVRGGTFTVNNTGALGSILSAPIINQSQAAIITLEAIVKRPVVVTTGDGDDSIAIRHIANSCLTFDHRILDGLAASRFLQSIKAALESVGLALLG